MPIRSLASAAVALPLALAMLAPCTPARADERAERIARAERVEEAERAALQPICAVQALRDKAVALTIERGHEYERKTARWNMDTACEQLDLSAKPVHETADPADAASHLDWIYDARWSPDGKLVLTAGRDKSVRLWDAATGKPVRRIDIGALTQGKADARYGMVRSARFLDGGRSIVVTADGHPVRIFDAATGETIAEVPYQHPDSKWDMPPFIATTASGLIVLGGYGGDIVVYDPRAKTERFRLKGVPREYPRLTVADGAGLLAAALPGGERSVRLQVVKLDGGQPVWSQVIEGGRSAGALAFSADGAQLAVDVRGQAHVYAVAEKRLVTTFTVHPYFASSTLAFTADGKRLIAGLRHAVLWDVATGKRVHHFGPFSDLCHSLDISPDGRFLLTSHIGSDGRIWEIATGTFHRRLGKNVRPPG